jgi:preprotein translocase subunit SecG
MKRLVVATLAIVMIMCLQTTTVFASGLQIVDTHPKTHDTRVFPLNFAVRVYFNQAVSGARYIDENNAFVVVRDEEGYEHPVMVIFNPDNPEMMLVWMTEELPVNTHFELTISGDFTTGGGTVLGDDFVLRFATRDMQRDMNTSMILMFVFFIVMMIISSRQMKRKAQKEAEEKEKNSRVNPYKVSKKTGKPVKDIVEKTEKEKRKKEAAEAKLKEEQDSYYDELDEFEEYNDNYRVAEPRTISAFSTYKSGRKAKAEAEAKKRSSAGTTRPKNQSGKAKNNKKK